jgi:hypothetical protein
LAEAPVPPREGQDFFVIIPSFSSISHSKQLPAPNADTSCSNINPHHYQLDNLPKFCSNHPRERQRASQSQRRENREAVTRQFALYQLSRI